MKNKHFQEEVEKRIGLIQKTLAVKAIDYARNDNRIHNFERAAEMMRCTPEQACVSFMTKHLVSVFDLVDDLDRGADINPAVWEEKIGDAINYLILLECILRERRCQGEI